MSLIGAITNSHGKYRGLFRPRERAWTPRDVETGPPPLPSEAIAAPRENADFGGLTEWTFAASMAHREEFGAGPSLNIVAAYESLMEFENDDACGF